MTNETRSPDAPAAMQTSEWANMFDKIKAEMEKQEQEKGQD